MKSRIIIVGISTINFLASAITSWQWLQVVYKSTSIQIAFTNVWFYITMALVIIGFSFLFLLRKINNQKRQIEILIEESNKIKNESIVTEFMGQPLVFSHLKYQISKYYNNNINLSLFSIKNKVCPGDDSRRDSIVLMELIGVCTASCYCFKFVITGQSVVRANDLKMKAKDLITNEGLFVEAENIGSKNEVKEFRVSFKGKGKKIGEPIHISLTWTWPKMLELTNDFITLPNYFSKETQSIRFMLEKDKDQKFKSVSIYKYSPCMKDVEFICNVEVLEDKKTFIFELDEPDLNTDYIMSYK